MDVINACIIAAANADLSTCRPVGLGIVDWITIGAAVAAIIGTLFALGRWIWSPFSQQNIKTFKQLRGAIKPLMDDNSRMFKNFAPNSGANNADEKLRFDQSIWKNLLPKVDKNNSAISKLIQSHCDVIPHLYSPTFERWLEHIDAFHAHMNDKSVGYREFQFPDEVIEIVNGK